MTGGAFGAGLLSGGAMLFCEEPGQRGRRLGGVAERLKAHAWKACVRDKRTAGSNPAPSASYIAKFLASGL